jgi:hypothetical protein
LFSLKQKFTWQGRNKEMGNEAEEAFTSSLCVFCVCVGVLVVTMGDMVVVVKSIWGEIKSLGTFVY